MKKIFTTGVVILLTFLSAVAQNSGAKKLRVVTGNLIRVTEPVKNFKRGPSTIKNIKVRDEDGIIGEKEEMEEMPELPKYKNKPFTGDAGLQKSYPNVAVSGRQGGRQVINNFKGIEYTNVTPADPSVAVGPNHVIQIVNGASGALFSIFSKIGDQVVPPTYLDNITGRGGLGDPIVLYDQLADRFVMTEFVNKNETGTQGLTISVSQTNDPTGSWYVYFFSTGAVFPDYPKFSVWGDAYYAKTNDFNTTNNYVGSSVYAFDRAKMIAGNATASMQVINCGMGYKEFSMVPVLLQGSSLPPAGSGGLFAYLQEDVWSGSNTDSVGLMEFKVDFNVPANSSIKTKSSMAAANYNSSVCETNRGQCISQPGTTVMLEALDQRIMNQPIYRNFESYEGIVFANVVNNGSNISGVRWYELVKTTGNWSIHQQSTYSPDVTHRFMPAICYDSKGNIGLVYNVSSAGVYPGIRYTGRKQCDDMNIMTYAENPIMDGTAANLNSRYGDYSHLVCDPDGSTFWFTGMYNTTAHWSTRIASFTLDTCVVTCAQPSSLTSSNITISSATLSWTGSGNVLNYAVEYKPSTSSTWVTAIAAINSSSFNLTGLAAATTYDWRVRTNCPGSNSSYETAQFTTDAFPPCNPPASLVSSGITTASAIISWEDVPGAAYYIVDYKASASSTWISAATSLAGTSLNLTALSPGTAYDWRVSTNCTNNASTYSSASFTTTQSCDAPSGLASSNITSTGAAVSWNAVNGATSYAVDYKTAAATTWTSATTSTKSLSVYLTLSANTTYNWRVKTNCSTLGSTYSTAQLTTLPAVSCSAPSSPAASAITTNSATVAWRSVSGALSYSVDYKPSTSTAWINAATGITTVSFSLTGLQPSTIYNWRVRSTCSAGIGAYVNAQFTTLVLCNPPTSLASNNISTNGATVTWTGVAGAASYSLDYKTAAATTWTSATTSNTTKTYTFTTLLASTTYQWRVKSNCTGNTSSYSTSQFTTAAPCPDALESNNTITAAAPITPGNDVVALIATSTDLDFYSFSNSATQNNIRITLTNLPANYDMKLFNPSGVAVLTAAATGTVNETINYNTSVIGTYKVEVYGYNKAYNATKCYTLKAITGSASFAPEIYRRQVVAKGLTLYPVPASQEVTLMFNETERTDEMIFVQDQLGNIVISKVIPAVAGSNTWPLDIRNLPNGVYIIKVSNSKETRTQKLIVAN